MTANESDHEALVELLSTFGRAFFRADREALAACTTDDFEWHQHSGPNAPHGRVVRNLEEVCAEVEGRRATWQVRYGDFETHTSPGLITSTFTVKGSDSEGNEIDVRAVDLYPVKNGKIARKDSFWKQIKA